MWGGGVGECFLLLPPTILIKKDKTRIIWHFFLNNFYHGDYWKFCFEHGQKRRFIKPKFLAIVQIISISESIKQTDKIIWIVAKKISLSIRERVMFSFSCSLHQQMAASVWRNVPWIFRPLPLHVLVGFWQHRGPSGGSPTPYVHATKQQRKMS